MAEKALVEISGGPYDGSVFEINIDPNTGGPPSEFDISEDGFYLLNPSHTEIIGRRYGSSPTQPDLTNPKFPNIINLGSCGGSDRG